MNKRMAAVGFGVLAIGLTFWIFQNKDHVKVMVSQPFDPAQSELRQQVEKVEPYAAVLVRELAWDPDLARAFMLLLDKGKNYRRFDKTGWVYHIGIAQLTRTNVYDALDVEGGMLSMDASNCLWELEGDMLMLNETYRKGHLPKETFDACIAQWQELDLRFDSRASMAVLIDHFQQRHYPPKQLARDFLRKKGVSESDLDIKLSEVEALHLRGHRRVELTQKSVRQVLLKKVRDAQAFLKQPSWFIKDKEDNQNLAVAKERELYGDAVRYMTVDGIRDDFVMARSIMKIESCPDIGLVIDPEIGKLDPKNREWYKTLNPDLWAALYNLAKDCHDRFKTDLVIMSGNRPVSYQNEIGNVSVSHPTGKAVDIQIDPRPCWRWVNGREVIEHLRKHCEDYGVDFYTERARNELHIFLTK